MAAAVFNLTGQYAIERGACFSYTMDLSTASGEYDLSSSVISGYMRRKWDDFIGPYFTSTILSAPSGQVLMELSASETSSLTRDIYTHEVFQYPTSGCPVRILQSEIVDIIGGGNK